MENRMAARGEVISKSQLYLIVREIIESLCSYYKIETRTIMENQVILLVEDSEDDAFLFKWMFEKAGTDFRLQHAQNGAEAIEFLRTASSLGSLPRIVLLDLKMPILNGFEVLSWMRQQTFSDPVPVVVLSGSAQQGDKELALRLGAVDYFVKPVTLAELQRILALVSSTRASTPLAEIGACP